MSRRHGSAGDSRLKLSLGDIKVTVDVRPNPQKGRDSDDMRPRGWHFCTPLELKILRLLASGAPMSRQEIARRVDETPDGRIKGTLAALGVKCWISVTSEGYRLNVASEELEETRAWLDTLGEESDTPCEPEA